MKLGQWYGLATIGLWIGSLAGPPPVASQADSTRVAHPTLEDLFRVASLGGVQISPDGQEVLYTVRTSDLEKNKTNTDVWLLTLPERGRPESIQLTRNPENDTSPRWRPDGAVFAFLSARPDATGKPDKAALYLMRPHGGEPERLYQHETAITAFAWLPDGSRIAFLADDPEPADAKAKQERGRDIAREGDPGAFRHLWLLDVAARRARRITGGREYSVSDLAVSPDGRSIAFAAAPSPNITDSWRSDLYLVGTDSGAVPRRLTTNPGPDDSPVFSPDGKFIYYHSIPTDRYRVGYRRVYRISIEGGQPEDASPDLDLEPSDYQFTPDGKGAFFEAVTGTTRAIFYLPLDTRRAVRLTGDQGVFGQASVSRDGRRLAFVGESMTKPQELYAAALLGKPAEGVLKNLTALTRHNALAAPWAVGLSDVVRWKSSDGRPIEGILVYPAGWTPARGPAALVVKIHGGPSGVYLQNFQASGYGADAQRYAADGYAVLLPNPRGSAGYGDAAQQAVVKDWGGLDFQDIMTGVDTLIARGIAHPDSLGVMGWSYGGYLTAWTISQTNRFKAAVVGAGITEVIAMWGTQDIVHVFEAYFGGSPWDPGAWEVYQKSSPLAHIRNAKTPTLIIHGRNDPRVPPNQAMLLYRTLKALNVPTELIWLPRTGHGPTEPGLQYETAKAQKAWMDRWIRGRPGAAAGAETR